MVCYSEPRRTNDQIVMLASWGRRVVVGACLQKKVSIDTKGQKGEHGMREPHLDADMSLFGRTETITRLHRQASLRACLDSATFNHRALVPDFPMFNNSFSTSWAGRQTTAANANHASHTGNQYVSQQPRERTAAIIAQSTTVSESTTPNNPCIGSL
jgi:hypothetical protein